MPSPIDYKTLVNVEMVFLYVVASRKFNSERKYEEKRILCPLFLYNLALITHDATKSVNRSIDQQVRNTSVV